MSHPPGPTSIHGMPYGDTGQQQPYHGGYPAPPVAYAGWVARVAGYLIDGLIVGALPIALTVIAAAAFVEEPSVDPETLAHDPGGVQTPGIVLYIAAAVIALITGLWMLHKEGTTGQSVGKKTLNIRLLREPDMQPLGFGGAFGRKLAHVLDSMACYLGWLWPLWDAKKQTFADKVTKSVVVKTGRQQSH